MKNLFALACGPLAVLVVAACSSSSTTTPTPTPAKDTGTVVPTDSGTGGNTDTGTVVTDNAYTHAIICLHAAAAGNVAGAHRFAAAATVAADDKSVSFQLKALKTPAGKPEQNATTLSVSETVGDMFELNDAPLANDAFKYTAPAGELVTIVADGNPVSPSAIELENLVFSGSPTETGNFCGGFYARVNKPAGPLAGKTLPAKCIFYPLAPGATLPKPVKADFDACPNIVVPTT